LKKVFLSITLYYLHLPLSAKRGAHLLYRLRLAVVDKTRGVHLLYYLPYLLSTIRGAKLPTTCGTVRVTPHCYVILAFNVCPGYGTNTYARDRHMPRIAPSHFMSHGLAHTCLCKYGQVLDSSKTNFPSFSRQT